MDFGDRNHQAGWTGYMNADVRYDKRLNSTAKVIMVEISALTNMKGYAWCTNQYLADAFGLSKSQVSRIIRQLAECGYINVYLNPGGERYITITSNDRPVPSGFKKDYTKKPESNGKQDDKLLEEVTTVDELLPEEKEPVDTSETEMRELTTAEQCALQTKNIEADNYDRRNNVIDEDLYHKLKLEVIAESDAKKAEEEAKKQPERPAVQQIEANTGNTNSAVATTANSNIATSSPYGELATPMTGTRSNYDPAEKAFYDAAKSLGVTITNHNQARKWVKEVVRTRGLESAVNYFDFMRIAFPRWQYEFKPTVKTTYDLVTKAAQIEQLIQRQREEKARKIDYDNIDFYGDAK